MENNKLVIEIYFRNRLTEETSIYLDICEDTPESLEGLLFRYEDGNEGCDCVRSTLMYGLDDDSPDELPCYSGFRNENGYVLSTIIIDKIVNQETGEILATDL